MTLKSGWCLELGSGGHDGCLIASCPCKCGHPHWANLAQPGGNVRGNGAAVRDNIGTTKDGPEGLTVGAGDVFLRASPDAVRSAELMPILHHTPPTLGGSV